MTAHRHDPLSIKKLIECCASKKTMWAAGLLIVAILFVPKEAFVSSQAEYEKAFAGYSVFRRVTIGQTTPPQGEAAGVTWAEDNSRLIVEADRPRFESAFRHYLRGEHPYKRWRRWVDLSENAGDPVYSSPTDFLGHEFRLHLKKDTPSIIQDKIATHFILSQLHGNSAVLDIGRLIKEHEKLAKPGLIFPDSGMSADALENWLAMSPPENSSYLALAAPYRSRLEEIIRRPLPERWASPADQSAYLKSIRSRIVLGMLDGQAPGGELLRELETYHRLSNEWPRQEIVAMMAGLPDQMVGEIRKTILPFLASHDADFKKPEYLKDPHTFMGESQSLGE